MWRRYRAHEKLKSWAEAAAEEFESRWRQCRPEDTALFDQLGGAHSEQVTVDHIHVLSAANGIKRPWRLDIHGVCAAALLLASEIAAPLSVLLSNLLSSDEGWTAVTLEGFIKAKEQGPIRMTKTRGLLPQSVIMQLLHRIVMETVGPILDKESDRLGLSNLILGGAKGGQPLDLPFTASQVLEKGRDRHNAAAVAQGDV